MIHATRTDASTVTDESMTSGSHRKDGPTVGLHTLCVHPGWRARGLGTMLLEEYTQRVGQLARVERIALIAHEELAGFYERFLPLIS
jgi:GNAT superfamily N-acetyltransferase